MPSVNFLDHSFVIHENQHTDMIKTHLSLKLNTRILEIHFFSNSHLPIMLAIKYLKQYQSFVCSVQKYDVFPINTRVNKWKA